MPIVAAVATLEPETAANSVQVPMFECISPPGSHDSQCVIAAYIRSAIPERSRISPSSTNSGMANRMKLVEVDHAVSPCAR